MTRLFWRMPLWFHNVAFWVTGYKPVIVLPDEIIVSAEMARDAGVIDWKAIEGHAYGYRLMRFPR